jgi:hypothetical protein
MSTLRGLFYRSLPVTSMIPMDKIKAIEEGQKKEVEKLGLNEKIYYSYYPDGSVRCNILLLKTPLTPVARGQAFSSPNDNFSRVIGRFYARGRALRAFLKGRSTGKIKIFDINRAVADSISCRMDYKSEINPRITDEELKLFLSKEDYSKLS